MFKSFSVVKIVKTQRREGEGKREKEGYEKKGTKKLKEDKTYEQEWAGTTNISWILKK